MRPAAFFSVHQLLNSRAMLQSGLTWEEVLQFFYLGTGLDQVY